MLVQSIPYPNAFAYVPLLDLSGVSSGTIYSIPQTGRTMLLRGVIRSQRAGQTVSALQIRCNSDTGANYGWQAMRFSSTGTTSSFRTGEYQGALTATMSVFCPAANAPANAATGFRAIIPGYSMSDFDAHGLLETYLRSDTTAAAHTDEVQAFVWRNTAAITQLDVIESNGALFASGSFIEVELI